MNTTVTAMGAATNLSIRHNEVVGASHTTMREESWPNFTDGLLYDSRGLEDLWEHGLKDLPLTPIYATASE